MKAFLEYVAEDLLAKHGDNLSELSVVFPNKRASLFLSEHLARLAGKPVWSPSYTTISELFCQHSELQVADPIKLICDLHKSFTEQTRIDETLDHFYGWGQLLISDFDDIDKNMADADKVFANIQNIHELDDLSYLTEEQKETLKRFFANFSPDQHTELKQRFLRLWSNLGNIYHAFNQRLTEQGLAYEGALYRKVVEDETAVFERKQYIFVGFNLLQKVEQQLFKKLKEEGRARFYWDFDKYYMPTADNKHFSNEAGHFIAQHLSEFPNELDSKEESIYNNFSHKRNIRVISSSTENAQARHISKWLLEEPCTKGNDSSKEKPTRIKDAHKTAIVLCNEGLLQSIIHCLPNEVEKVNITTGYPLIQSPAASLVNLLIELQTTGYSAQQGAYKTKQINAVLDHPYMKYLTEHATDLQEKLKDGNIYYATKELLIADQGTEILFTHKNSQQELLEWICTIIQIIAQEAERQNVEETLDNPLFLETLFNIYTILNRLTGLMESGDLQIDMTTLQRLMIQLMSSATVPFHGEPVDGIQVMGVLETRNLDFDHLLLLSCNEGNMPKGNYDTSFIPYNIRKAYGLTTVDHKVAIYSYYFHRLLQRAEDITILYNNATTDGKTAEMSRFVLQLMVESPHSFEFNTLQANQSIGSGMPPAVEKTTVIMERLLQRFDLRYQKNPADTSTPLLTPTAINRYLRCQLQFYYYYVCHLHELDETEDDYIDNRMFGNIFHEAAQIIYANILNKSRQILKSDIEKLLQNRVDIERAVDAAFRKELFKDTHPAASQSQRMLNGLQIINREVIIHYLRQLLTVDERLAPFNIIGLEKDVTATLEIPQVKTVIGGRIDRLDQIEKKNAADGTSMQQIRVIDYKTGSKRFTPIEDIEGVFKQENISKHSDYYLQTLLYGSIVNESSRFNPSQLPVSPALLFIQHAGKDDYDPVLQLGKEKMEDMNNYQQVFMDLLKDTVSDIFNPDISFSPTEDKQRCTNCPYHLICTKN